MKITELSQFKDGMLVVRIRHDTGIRCHRCLLKAKIRNRNLVELYKVHNPKCPTTSDGELCSNANFTTRRDGEFIDYYESNKEEVTGVLSIVGDI